MKDLEYIDSYFKGELDVADTGKFEGRITGDNEFAEQVALYIATHQLALEQLENEKKQRFSKLYYSQRKERMSAPVRRLWQFAAAAAIIISIVVGVELLLGRNDTPNQMADHYIKESFETLGVKM